METVRIENVEARKSKKGGLFYIVNFNDGRKATTFDGKVSNMTGALVNCEFKKNGDFTNVEIFEIVEQGAPVEKTFTQQVKDIEPTVNPIFPFLGTCSLMGGMAGSLLEAGLTEENVIEYVDKHFSKFYEVIERKFKVHIALNDIKKTASALLE